MASSALNQALPTPQLTVDNILDFFRSRATPSDDEVDAMIASTAQMLADGHAFLAQSSRDALLAGAKGSPRAGRAMHTCFRPFAKVPSATVADDDDDDDEWVNCDSPEPATEGTASDDDDDVTFMGTTHASDTPAGTWETCVDGICVLTPKQTPAHRSFVRLHGTPRLG